MNWTCFVVLRLRMKTMTCTRGPGRSSSMRQDSRPRTNRHRLFRRPRTNLLRNVRSAAAGAPPIRTGNATGAALCGSESAGFAPQSRRHHYRFVRIHARGRAARLVTAPQSFSGISSRTSRLISLNSGVPATWHHSNKAASVVVNTAPDESIRLSAVSRSSGLRDPTASTAR